MLAVDARGGKTLLTVKNNQPALYADPHASFPAGFPSNNSQALRAVG
ncbi:hypothetical protein ccbrp13_35840 [Ktedonobacteria bacterium brp13]|nr:hypothetical protein ccbrp13_35840 [Ktedonobacteria bacterium brp13]